MTTQKKFVFFIVTAVLLMTVALFASVNFGPEAYATDKSTYSYDFSKFAYRRNETGVGIYYNGTVDADVYFRVIVDEEDPVDIKNTYFFDCAGTYVTLYVVRDEDDECNAYLSAPINLDINVPGEDIITLPFGQTKVYDGTAYYSEGVTFTMGGSVAEASDAGEYEATLNYTAPLMSLTLPFVISPAEVRVSPKAFSRRYLEKTVPSDINVYGNIPQADKDYIEENTFLDFDFDDNSLPGTYPIAVFYAGFDTNFEVIPRDGEGIIMPGLLSGFTFEDDSVLYDGKPHRITVGYDQTKWTDVTISYDVTEVTEEGKYTVNATVRKTYYEDLSLKAVLMIRTLSLESSSLDNFVKISGDEEGYDPTIVVTLIESKVENLSELVASSLKKGTGYQEIIMSTYDISLTSDGYAVDLGGGEYNVAMKISSMQSLKGVRLLRYNGLKTEEIKYTYENGYIKFTTDGLDGFVFVKRSTVVESSWVNFVIIGLIAVAGIFVVGIIITAFRKSNKASRRSRRRHKRWV